jgi:hypothetical protein
MTSSDRPLDPGLSERSQKACRKCGETKPLSEFYPQKGMKDGYRHNCKACHSLAHKDWYAKNVDYEKARVKKWQQANSDRVNSVNRRRRQERSKEYRRKERASYLLRKYGITLRDYETLRMTQLGMCVICRKIEWNRLHVDHDHQTGVLRGLLCGKCNKAIGLLDDDPALVHSAEAYLVSYRRASAARRRPRYPQRRPDADRSRDQGDQ